ncbi:MAG: zinc-finger domain-containing protein [Gammaproteobacteria bacterium]|nr:zinc-finger domain-containing protein [Gammaproteobacteria bacterium]
MENDTRKKLVVSKSELPVTCPLPGEEMWCMHPKVTIPLDQADKYNCPYCGRLFILDTKSS